MEHFLHDHPIIGCLICIVIALAGFFVLVNLCLAYGLYRDRAEDEDQTNDL